MQKLDLNKVNNIVSQNIISNQELKDVVNFYLNEQDKKYMSLKSNDYESEANKELALIDCRTWSFLQEILKGDDIQPFSREFRSSQIQQPNSQQNSKFEMEIENQNSLLSGSSDQFHKINQLCHDSNEKSIFYFEFYQIWNNKSDKQRMHLQSYDHNKMPNFLFVDSQTNCEMISLEKSKGMIAPKSYSDLEIIQDIIYYDNHLQRFSKLIKWVQNHCLTSEAFDPIATKIRRNSGEGISIEQLGDTNIENKKLVNVFSLLKQGQGESAYRFMQDHNMTLPFALIDSVFPYHDFQLSDSNNPLNLQTQLIQNELKSNFFVDIFDNVKYSEILKERISHYKKNGFNINYLFDSQVGNQNWLNALNSAYFSSQVTKFIHLFKLINRNESNEITFQNYSLQLNQLARIQPFLFIKQEKSSLGEILYFSYLSSNKSQLQRHMKSQNQWYESLWVNLKHLFLHEVIKRFLVIKGLLFDSIEQFYPSYENSFIDFSESPQDNYRKIFYGAGIDKNIYDELELYLSQVNEDKYAIQSQMILAYLNKDKLIEQSLWMTIYQQLLQTSKRNYDARDRLTNASVVCEFNAKIAFSLLHSQYIYKDDRILDYYDHIVEQFVLFLIPQDRSSEIIVFLKNLRDENIIFGLMARYISFKQSELERKKIKQEMMMYGYSDQKIQGVLKELVNSQFSAYDKDRENSVSDLSIIDGLKMFIESYQSNPQTCMQHFLSAARQFIQDEKLTIYSQMRDDREISAMINRYQQLTNSQGQNIEIERDSDPFLNQLSAFDDLIKCYMQLDQLNQIQQTQKSLKQSDHLRSSGKKSNFSKQMVPENEYKDSQLDRASEFISLCEKTFFKYNLRNRNYYIFVDGIVSFKQNELREYNNINTVVHRLKDISKQYLQKCITKCLDVAQTYKIHDKIITLMNKYYSPSFDTFTLFSFDEQESILKKSTAVLTQNTQFMRTVLNL